MINRHIEAVTPVMMLDAVHNIQVAELAWETTSHVLWGSRNPTKLWFGNGSWIVGIMPNHVADENYIDCPQRPHVMPGDIVHLTFYSKSSPVDGLPGEYGGTVEVLTVKFTSCDNPRNRDGHDYLYFSWRRISGDDFGSGGTAKIFDDMSVKNYGLVRYEIIESYEDRLRQAGADIA